MAGTKLSPCFVNCDRFGGGGVHFNNHSNSVRFVDFSFIHHRHRHGHRFLPPALCKMRRRTFSAQHKKQQVKKSSHEQPQIDSKLQPNGETDVDIENASLNYESSSWQEIVPNNDDEDIISEEVGEDGLDDLSRVEDNSLISPSPQDDNFAQHIVSEERPTSNQFDDLIAMVRNAERNVLLLNQARVQALENMEKIVEEKETLQNEINVLEMKLAETDAKIKAVTENKVHVELLQDQLEKMRKELSERSVAEEGIYEVPINNFPASWDADFHVLSKELSSLKEENATLKDDVTALKAELSNVNITDERVATLENERVHLESTVKNMESKLIASQEDVSRLSAMKDEYDNLCEKLHNLQTKLDNATKQADQAILVLQQNQELRKKVEKLEESLGEASAYKLTSEKMEQYNELMHQKIKLLEDRLERSDGDIDSYIQLYQASMKEFQDTLHTLKQEGDVRGADKPVNDMPWEFWSQMLLIIDGWLLEKKLQSTDANLLREMAWKRDPRICDAYMSCKETTERAVLSSFLNLISSPTRSGLHVIHIAAEMAPVAKVGGLGDVVAGLSKALQKKGHLVEIVLPKYDCMQYDLVNDLRVLDAQVESYFDGQLFKNKIWVGTVEGLPVYFIEPLHPAQFFWRGQYYGENDDFKRFSFFSQAALELILQAGKKPDIIHCHDWQTAFVAPLYWDLYAPKGLNSARICFTCHNFEYQGSARASELGSCGLDVYQMNRPDRMQDNSDGQRINPVKGAIVFSNIVTTVSPTYAQEVRTPEGGKGLNATLDTHSKKFIGILNGIDTDIWNPATDSFIKVQYTSSDLQGKAENKEALRKHLGLSCSVPTKPLVGCVTRLVPQKGVHLIRHAMYRTIELGGQFVLLGSSPVHHIQREFEGIANHFQNHDDARLVLKYDESLSHSIYAAADLLIIPSIFEPCGLTQMIAMRYGAIPIVRKTGGLNDSVFDVDDDTIPSQFRNGFTFLSPDEQGLESALDRALHYYDNNWESWEELVQKVMRIDFSWESSASQYEELYQNSVARARAARRA